MIIPRLLFFFFSSRRRHTRWNCDWSSDVCSSDLVEVGDSEHPRLQVRSAPFSYLRVMGTKPKVPKGYTPAGLKRWREHAQALAREGDVFLYFISGAKVRNPHAARALIAALP